MDLAGCCLTMELIRSGYARWPLTKRAERLLAFIARLVRHTFVATKRCLRTRLNPSRTSCALLNHIPYLAMTIDDAPIGWQGSPSRRGTLTIIENCLFTIFACTWSIQHLNIPKLGESRYKTVLRQSKWTLTTLLFPEFIMVHAILEFVMVVQDMMLLDKEHHLDDRLPWWFRWFRRPHSFDDKESGNDLAPPSGGSIQREAKWTLAHCYFANMGGFYIQDRSSPSENRLLSASHFAHSWKNIDVPNISEDDLNDKSKADYFTKAVAVIQITQLLLSLIVREVRHLAFSQLETLTLAFAICGVLTYICSWYKPQNVTRPIQVRLRKLEGGLPPTVQQRHFDGLWQILMNSKITHDSRPIDRIPNDNIPKVGLHRTHYGLYVLTIVAAGFGSIHAIAWNFEFPTLTEQILWRAATLISTVAPPAALLAIPLSQILRPWGDSHEFICTCLVVMREYGWHSVDTRTVQAAIEILRDARDNPSRIKHFRDILGDGDNPDEFLGGKLLEYIEDEENTTFRERLPTDFLPKFTQLVEVLRGSSGSKRLFELSQTNIYPQRNLFSPWVNDGIIYITAVIYCLARLGIIGVAFSSLRWMPSSVYTVTWTESIPNVR